MHFAELNKPPRQKCLKKNMQLQVAIQGRIQEFFIEAIQNLVQRGLLNLWQITSPPHPLPPGAKCNAQFIKKISQLVIYDPCSLKQASGMERAGGGGGVWICHSNFSRVFVL